MFFTWMIAANIWMAREDAPDPFRMDDERNNSAQVLPMPTRNSVRVPHEPKALVA